MSANTSFSFPAFTTPYNIPVIRNDHFEILHNNNFLKKVYYKQCQIETNSTIKETYYAIFPETDLGLPVGNMEFHEICKTCHNVDIKNQKEFLLSFKKSLFHDIDIARTSWLPYGSIFVSPRVYQIFCTIPEFDKSHEQIFSPVALKDL